MSTLKNHWKHFIGNIKHGLKTGTCELFFFNNERLKINYTRDQADGKGVFYRSDGTEEKVRYEKGILTVGKFRPKLMHVVKTKVQEFNQPLISF